MSGLSPLIMSILRSLKLAETPLACQHLLDSFMALWGARRIEVEIAIRSLEEKGLITINNHSVALVHAKPGKYRPKNGVRAIKVRPIHFVIGIDLKGVTLRETELLVHGVPVVVGEWLVRAGCDTKVMSDQEFYNRYEPAE